ncbi:hypothetical protein BV25DRAFT_1817642 [Artomyces pyxidatus]|uniref:Uncharacterized protein n=1 Tax=Artomyces pyxidatus TaxID=48021 RepID=A0ACB8TJV0_9AGAM|nr:hypothetical protein BV25DRAFT_1817642 [Artomyces pyxidatus]
MAHVSSRTTFLIILLSALITVAKAPVGPHPADPFLDPKDDPYNPLGYIASNTLTAIAFSLIMLSAIVETFSMFKWGAWWMSCMVIGEYTFAIGIGSRFGLHTHPESKGIYIIEYLFVVLSPCAFIAADYILLGRLAKYLNCGQHLAVSPNRIMITFLASDITTFLIQAAGGGISIGATTNRGASTGSHVFLVGLIIQLLSFATFTTIFYRFLYRVHKYEPQVWTRDQGKPWYLDWRILVVAMSVSCVGIIIRSIYRVVELSQGFTGAVARLEGLFFGLDTLPLWICFVIYVPFWPGRIIRPDSATAILPANDEGSRSSGEQVELEKVV